VLVPGVAIDLLSELASFFWRVEDLIVEYGEVECETEADGVRRGHFTFADLERLLVRLLTVLNYR
jgi:hypothetical protein